jgi:hypothetical protein
MLTDQNEQSGLLGNIGQFSYINPSWPNITLCPFFEPKESLESAQEEIQSLFSFMNQNSAHHISHSFLMYEPPDGGERTELDVPNCPLIDVVVLVLDEVDVATGKLSFQVMYNDNFVYTRRSGMRLPSKIRFELNSIVHAIHSAFCTLRLLSSQFYAHF